MSAGGRRVRLDKLGSGRRAIDGGWMGGGAGVERGGGRVGEGVALSEGGGE